MNVLYLHGFASSPTSSKATFFRQRFEERGHVIVVPDLNEGGFEHLTISRMRGVVNDLLAAMVGPRIVVGSSLGGYVAALCAAEASLDGLVLLAPAFDPVSRWTAMAKPGELAQWERDGTAFFDHHAFKCKMPLRYDFFVDAGGHAPWPPSAVPTLVLQGLRDETVPVETAREYARRNPHVVLREIDTDHEMLGALPGMWDEVSAFLSARTAVGRC